MVAGGWDGSRKPTSAASVRHARALALSLALVSSVGCLAGCASSGSARVAPPVLCAWHSGGGPVAKGYVVLEREVIATLGPDGEATRTVYEVEVKRAAAEGRNAGVTGEDVFAWHVDAAGRVISRARAGGDLLTWRLRWREL